MDYVLADRIVLPIDQQPFFSEKIVHLPDCYQANDATRVVPPAPIARRSRTAGRTALSSAASTTAGRSPRRCSTSGCGCWRRLTAACCGCWTARMPTICAHEATGARRRSRRGWCSRPSCRRTQHLARHQLADLFLDTLPYNAHTTCSDALWAGLPVVTCYGKAFHRPGRRQPAESDRPARAGDAHRPEDYEALALELAKNPALLKATQAKSWRATAPPRRCIDSERFRKNIEAAYEAMLA